MASSPAYLNTAILPWKKKKKNKNISRLCQSFQVRAQSYRDEAGGSSNLVDGNLEVLRKRIREVKNKERLEKCCLQAEAEAAGWNYHAPVKNNSRNKIEVYLGEFVETAGTVVSTFGLTILCCSCCLCFIALIVHLDQLNIRWP